MSSSLQWASGKGLEANELRTLQVIHNLDTGPSALPRVPHSAVLAHVCVIGSVRHPWVNYPYVSRGPDGH